MADTSTHHDFLIVGLPAAGKSTFLAALWELLDSGHISNVLRLGSVANTDRTYLNRIRDQWLKCEPVPHTASSEEQLLTIPLTDGNGDHEFEVRVPDLSGETFQRHWSERQWLPEFHDLAKQATGCLMFVNPLKIVEPSWLEEAAFAETALPEHEADSRTTGSVGSPTPWNPEDSPTQVILVDILQSLLRFKAGSQFKVAVVVSAWDAVQHQQMTPNQWINRHLPFLRQFLSSNARICESKIFGISAQGGDLIKHKKVLQDFEHPSERLICVDDDSETGDISAPIRWLAGLL